MTFAWVWRIHSFCRHGRYSFVYGPKLEPGLITIALGRAERREVPEADFWRVALLQKLLSERLLANYAANVENEKRLEGLVSSLVQN